MDFAKVDIEKLQLLNDRIQQTIEALQQVRMSVHGIAAGIAGQVPMTAGAGLSHSGYGTPYFAESAYGDPWSQRTSASAARYNPWAYPQSFGLSHAGVDPYRAWKSDPRVYGRIAETFPFLGVDPGFKPIF
jgi:hypothetical protein